MQKVKGLDHNRVGRQLWLYYDPPHGSSEVKGFEDEIPQVCLDKIGELLPRCQELKLERDAWIKIIRELNRQGSMEEWWLKIWAASEFSEFYVIQRWLKYWVKLWQVASDKPLPKKTSWAPGWIDERDIECARLKPIEDLYDGRLRKVGNKRMGLCPLHQEKTPSFCVFPNNLFHCFGCQAHGDAISFVMKTKGLSFPQAVKELL